MKTEAQAALTSNANVQRILFAKGISSLLLIAAIVGGLAYMAPVSGRAGDEAAPIFVKEIPEGYRDWKLISVAHEEGNLTDIRAILGNDIAIKAYRGKAVPFPEGTIIARIAWSYDASEENNKAFAPFLKQGFQKSFVAGSPTNGVQFMIKDSIKYAATGGWGYGQFDGSKPVAAAMLQNCFRCHQAIKERDFIFTRYAP